MKVKLKTEIVGEAIIVAPHLFEEPLGTYLIKAGQIGIEHDTLPADKMDAGLNLLDGKQGGSGHVVSNHETASAGPIFQNIFPCFHRRESRQERSHDNLPVPFKILDRFPINASGCRPSIFEPFSADYADGRRWEISGIRAYPCNPRLKVRGFLLCGLWASA